ncbi:MAG TPA: bifunctional riboflavin kinase/FAD synthetase [Aeromicrobium sp.]|nr:bifunctional riboflavin kinase/FAD synthetase [Aeromicrobium sp.]
MAIWKSVAGASATAVAGPSVVTIGNFDGVHRGHQALLAATKELAADRTTVAVTFDPHPVSLFRPDAAPKKLTSLARRVDLLHQAGADEVRILDFTMEMAAWSPQDFVERVILDQCQAQAVVVGEGFRYGNRAAGTIETLTNAGEAAGFEVTALTLAGDGETFASSRVREAIAAGNISQAAQILGRPPEVEGVVIEGDRRGREIGFPTANIPVDDEYAVPPDGVYATWVNLPDGSRAAAATSIGTNPTFENVAGRRVESYVLDRDDLFLYGNHLRVEFVEHLREMVAFDSLADLLAQMDRDVEQARAILKG